MNTPLPIRLIGIIAFPGVEALDITGPYEVFTFANSMIQKECHIDDVAYSVKILAAQTGPVTTLSGMQVIADLSYRQIEDSDNYDSLLVPGGDPEVVLANIEIVELLKQMLPRVSRLVSICTGAFLLAETGLLDGGKATTHWNWCDEFSQKFPRVILEPDRIFVKEGNIYSSGGITSGIDLALAMVEEDWGQKIALAVAQFMVVYLKRPGGQSQFSHCLFREASNVSGFRDLQFWIIEHPDEDLRVETLAAHMAMSTRNFARLFFSETGITPAKYVQMVRMDAAINLLETTKFKIGYIADKTGFKDTENMRRTFIRQLGVNPSDYRKQFCQLNSNDKQAS